MSSWAVLLALQGFGLNSISRELSFRTSDSPRTFLFNTPGSWGRVSIPSQDGGVFVLEVLRGKLSLKKLVLAHHKGIPEKVIWNGNPIEFTELKDDDGIGVEFSEEIILSMGSELSIESLKK